MDNVQNYMHTKHSFCIHSKLCQIIFDNLKSIETTDSGVKYIEVLQTGKTVNFIGSHGPGPQDEETARPNCPEQ